MAYDAGPLIEQNVRNFKSGAFQDQAWLNTTVAYDLETEGLGGAITIAAWANGSGSGVHFPPRPPTDQPYVFHNGKYDLHALLKEGYPTPENTIFDTWCMAWLLDENRENGLKPLAQSILGRTLATWESVRANTDDLHQYAIADAKATHDLFSTLYQALQHEGLLKDLLAIEINILPLIVEIEQRGLRVDTKLLDERLDAIRPRLDASLARMRTIVPDAPWICRKCAGSGLWLYKGGPRRGQTEPCPDCDGSGDNTTLLGSEKQLGELLFKVRGHKPAFYTKKRNPSLSALALQKMLFKKDDPFLRELLHHRELFKLWSTYYLPYKETHLQPDGRVYPEYLQWGTVTGRFASARPNNQNNPSEVRELIIPDEGMSLISADYSQIELYLMAHFANERNILDVYGKTDLHQRTADLIGRDRFTGKTVNFALSYGLTPNSLASRLNCSKTDAQALYTQLVGSYSELFGYFGRLKHQAREQGYVESLFGRRRRIHGASSRDFEVRYHAENQACNAPIQGSAADLVKAAMISLKRRVPEFQQLGQVHDEIFGQAPTTHVEEIANEVKQVMQTCVPGLVPLVDVKIQQRWGKTT